MLDVLTSQFDLLSKPVDPIILISIVKNCSKMEFANIILFYLNLDILIYSSSLYK